MKIFWTPEARHDRETVWEYISSENLTAAARMDERFSKAVEHLAANPRIGKPGQIAGTRELLPHEHYRLIYEVDGDTIWILTIIHIARRWPPLRSTLPSG